MKNLFYSVLISTLVVGCGSSDDDDSGNKSSADAGAPDTKAFVIDAFLVEIYNDYIVGTTFLSKSFDIECINEDGKGRMAIYFTDEEEEISDIYLDLDNCELGEDNSTATLTGELLVLNTSTEGRDYVAKDLTFEGEYNKKPGAGKNCEVNLATKKDPGGLKGDICGSSVAAGDTGSLEPVGLGGFESKVKEIKENAFFCNLYNDDCGRGLSLDHVIIRFVENDNEFFWSSFLEAVDGKERKYKSPSGTPDVSDVAWDPKNEVLYVSDSVDFGIADGKDELTAVDPDGPKLESTRLLTYNTAEELLVVSNGYDLVIYDPSDNTSQEINLDLDADHEALSFFEADGRLYGLQADFDSGVMDTLISFKMDGSDFKTVTLSESVGVLEFDERFQLKDGGDELIVYARELGEDMRVFGINPANGNVAED